MSELSLRIPPLILMGSHILGDRSGQSLDSPGTDRIVHDFCILLTYQSATGQWQKRGMTTSCPMQSANSMLTVPDSLKIALRLLTYCSGKTTLALPVPKQSSDFVGDT